MTDSPAGVCFPKGGDGKRSTTATGRAVFADSVREVDPGIAERIEHTRDWRSGYLEPLRDIVAAAAMDSASALSISRSGLSSVHRRFRFARDGEELMLAQAMDRYRERRFSEVRVRGTMPRQTDLSVPYRGSRLFGDDLMRQLERWVQGGIAEPSFAECISAVLANPDWLDLSDLDIVVLGAGAEMGPTRSLLRWGATVHAVDLPHAGAWQRLIGIARGTAGMLRIPIALTPDGAPPFVVDGEIHPEDDATVAAAAGADLLLQTPELRTWIAEVEGPMVIGCYAYADGAKHVLLSVAADAIVQDLLASRSDIALAFLATPTDAFMVPLEAVEASRARWDARGLSGLVQAPLRLLRQFQPNYPQVLRTADGRTVGINDSLVPQQGPNYALAKRLQRWRAMASRADGVTTSANLAPATKTQSVVKNRALAAAYAGADRFGVEVFEPATSTALMAALLVHDLRNPLASSRPASALANPLDLFVAGANHGGLWRTAYAPRSVLGIAAVLGMLDSRA